MTKACIRLRAETYRLCKQSVTDRNYCEMFIFPVREVCEAPCGPPEPSEVGWQPVWGGVLVIDFLSKVTRYRQTFSDSSKKVAIS